MRNVRQIYAANSSHWVGDGFLVQPLFSHMGADRGTNPFLMLDYAAPQYFQPNQGASRGVGQHPHKGFETVTIAYHGEVAHRDSSGGGGVIKAGDVQWMTAGAGVIHEEFHSPEFSKRGGLFEMVQLWVNLPSKDKLTAPRYQHLSKEAIGQVDFSDQAGYVRVIAGKYEQKIGPAQTFSPMNVWDIVLNPHKTVSLRIPTNHNLTLVILRGKVRINEKDLASEGQLVSFDHNEEVFTLTADSEEVKILLLSGEPIDEPVVGYGPFVMNTKEEITQAIREYQSGQFGQIPR